MDQPAFDFFGYQDRETLPPINGHTPMSRDASRSGALAVVEVWTARQSAYLQLLKQAGALTDHEAAALLKCGLFSVNSVRNAVKDLIVEDGHDLHQVGWTKPRGRKPSQPIYTKRTRWKLRESR